MKLKLFGMLVLCGIVAGACKKGTDDTSVGGGGSGSTTNTTTKTASSSTKTSSAGSSMTGTCDDIGVCAGNGMDPSSGCLECAVLGDSSIATDGGDCATAYTTCFGTDAMCTGGTQGCCTYYDCANACDANMDGMYSATELACVCTTADGMNCDMMQMDPNTCLGALVADMAALQAAAGWETCAFGDQTTPGVCTNSCM